MYFPRSNLWSQIGLTCCRMQVKPAGAKGNGAFARQQIPKGSFIGNYEGELLSAAAFWQRYPAGEVSQTHEGRDMAISSMDLQNGLAERYVRHAHKLGLKRKGFWGDAELILFGNLKARCATEMDLTGWWTTDWMPYHTAWLV